MNKFLISIVGPTAIGKTALSIKLAQYFNSEIISADSRQFYKEMEIGTAAPSSEELNQIKHHFIHHISIEENYNVGSYEKDALKLLNTLFKKTDIVILVGGSGLYVNAVLKGLDNFPTVDASIRKSLNKDLNEKGIGYLQAKLKVLDVTSYKNIVIENPHRVIRALEISIGTGQPYSSFLNQEKTKRDFETISIGLSAEREIIYNRINKRVDLMMKDGLLKEVESLKSKEHLNALNTVGYKELFKYLNKECDLDFAVSEIKKNTRRFAKRQITWFKKDPNTKWFNYSSDSDNIVKYINKKIQLDS